MVLRTLAAIALGADPRASGHGRTHREGLFGARSTPPRQRPPRSAAIRGAASAGAVQLPETGPDLAGDAAVAEPQLGPPRDDRLHPAPVARGREAARLGRALHRRHQPAARRADAHGPRQPPDRARRRHLDAAADTAEPQPGASARRSRSISAPLGRPAPTSTATGRARITSILRAAAKDPRVDRIFVFRRRQGRDVQGRQTGDRGWLHKIRPWYGHHYHFHVRLNCPRGARGCADAGRPRPTAATAATRRRTGGSNDILNPPPPDPNAPPRRSRAARTRPWPTCPSNAAPSWRRADRWRCSRAAPAGWRDAAGRASRAAGPGRRACPAFGGFSGDRGQRRRRCASRVMDRRRRRSCAGRSTATDGLIDGRQAMDQCTRSTRSAGTELDREFRD